MPWTLRNPVLLFHEDLIRQLNLVQQTSRYTKLVLKSVRSRTHMHYYNFGHKIVWKSSSLFSSGYFFRGSSSMVYRFYRINKWSCKTSGRSLCVWIHEWAWKIHCSLRLGCDVWVLTSAYCLHVVSIPSLPPLGSTESVGSNLQLEKLNARYGYTFFSYHLIQSGH